MLDWRTLDNVRDFLRAFYYATKEIEDRHDNLSLVVRTMEILAQNFEKAVEEFTGNDFMRESLHAGYTKLLRYWNKTERSPAYVAATVLDSTRESKYFKRWYPDLQPDMEATTKEFWETTYRSPTDLSSSMSTPTPSAMIAHSNNGFLLWERQQQENDVTGDEFDVDIHNYPHILPKGGRTILDWWLEPEQRAQLPLLSKTVIDIYSIPVMSSEPERASSGARDTLSDQRSSLECETIEMVECLKSWFRLGIFTEEDLNAVVHTLNENGALEALEEGLDDLDDWDRRSTRLDGLRTVRISSFRLVQGSGRTV